MWDRKWFYFFLLLLLVLSPTFLYLLIKPFYFIERALFVYDYFLVAFLFLINIRTTWLTIIFGFIFLLDCGSVFSKLYMFEFLDFLGLIKYAQNYTFGFYQIITVIFVFIAFFVLYSLMNIIRKNLESDKIYLNILLIIIASIFILDIVNSTSSKLRSTFDLQFYKGNIASSPSVLLNISLNNQNANVNRPTLRRRNDQSVTFNEFALDSSGNQMLIIVESFGLIRDSIKRENFEQGISSVYKSKNWKTSWDKTRFLGSTTKAELRELINCSGDYRYFIKNKNANMFLSIFNIKNRQGYHTKAVHSFNGDIFERSIWWKNIGIDSVFFSTDIQMYNSFQNQLNFESPFTSVFDEDAFNFLQAITDPNLKQFTYFLTVNTHLNYKGIPKEPIISRFFDINKEVNLSQHAKNQNKRISNILTYIGLHLDSKKFQKILIIGDHMPPFDKDIDRNFYDEKYVPYLIISK